MNWNLRTLRTRILSRAEVVEHFVPVHSELEHKTVEHFDPEHKTVEHMDPGPLQKLPSKFFKKSRMKMIKKEFSVWTTIVKKAQNTLYSL